MFILMVIINATYAFFSYALGLNSADNNLVLNRVNVIRFALLFTVVYSAIILIAIKLKRKWRREDDPDSNRPENLIIALVSYAASLLFSVPFSLYLRHEMTVAPFLFAINHGILGYFIGVYIDRSLRRQGISLVVAAWQGATQLITVVIATSAAPLPNLGSRNELYVTIFSSAQSALSGFLIGVFFQYFHQRCSDGEQDRVRNASSATSVGTSLLSRGASIASRLSRVNLLLG
jgi:hypothetical protein